jgi:hypothetical protein
MEERILSARAAALIGVKTQTLAKWRCLGKGPQGWIQVSATHVTYPTSEVERFLAARAAATGTPRARPGRCSDDTPSRI